MKLITFTFKTASIISLLYLCFGASANTTNDDFFGANSRWSLDLSTRAIHNLENNNTAFVHVVGLDLHNVLSVGQRDVATITFQPYIVKLNNHKTYSSVFDHGNDTELTWRIANVNYTGFSQGQFNVRLGHFEIPFGLEYHVDTNGTLRQLTTSDRGIKADWGLSVNGITPIVEYEVALTRGSGNSFKNTGDPYIFSGRIGTPTHKNLIGGFSWFTGDVLHGKEVVERKKLGVDVSYYYYQWQFMMESSVGETAGNDTANVFIEALWKTNNEEISSYLQFGYQRNEINHQVSDESHSTGYWKAGIQWVSHQGYDISAQYKNKFKESSIIDIDPVLGVQLRYRM